MKCPVDTEVDLAMTERQGVEIDYCPTCRGVWLDRGELDKILNRAAEPAAAAPPVRTAGAVAPPEYAEPRRDDVRYRDDSRRDDSRRDDSRDRDDSYGRTDRDRPHAKKKRKESWLGDLLDFG